MSGDPRGEIGRIGTSADTESRDRPDQRLGLWGLIRMMHDPDGRPALSVLAHTTRRFGQAMDLDGSSWGKDPGSSGV
jgi:hypothetical protein